MPERHRWLLEVFQLPSPATPRLSEPEKVATLKGQALNAVEHRVLNYRMLTALERLAVPSCQQPRSAMKPPQSPRNGKHELFPPRFGAKCTKRQ